MTSKTYEGNNEEEEAEMKSLLVREYAGLSDVIDIVSLPDPGERFQVEALLGEGTYGEVHSALDRQTGRKVAVKIVDEVADNVEELEEEFRVLSAHWLHPNIPRFVGMFFRRSAALGTDRKDDQVWIAIRMWLCE